MAGPGTIKNLRLQVGSDNKIRGSHDLVEIFGDIDEISISLSPDMERDILMWIRMLREDRLVYREEFETIGANLYSVLLDNKIGEMVNRILFEHNNTGGVVDILRIELEFAEKQQKLANWPWEYLFCRQTHIFLAESRRLVLLRHNPFPYIARPILINESPIRVLFVAASPKELTQIKFDRVSQSMEDLEGTTNFKVTSLTSPPRKSGEQQVQNNIAPTRKNFIDTINVRNFNPHMIHFVGHGRYHEGGCQLAFTDGKGDVDWVYDHQLASWLMDNQELRLVFFQAGESAGSNSYNPYQDFSGLANHLASKNVPAVIAMQYKIKAGVADLFASTFYGALSHALSIEEAVQEGRLQVQSTMNSDEEHSYAFCLPVLYMNGSGALLSMQKVPFTSISKDGISKSRPLLFCAKCGVQRSPKSKFCNNCGAPLEQPHNSGTNNGTQTG